MGNIAFGIATIAILSTGQIKASVLCGVFNKNLPDLKKLAARTNGIVG